MILHLVTGFMLGGSVPRRAAREAAYHRLTGADARVVTDRRHERLTLPTDLAIPADLPVVKLRCPHLPGPLHDVSMDLSFNARLLRLLPELHHKEGISLIVAHASAVTLAAAQFCSKARIPCAFLVHALIWDRIQSGANPYNPLLTAWYKFTNRYALRHADKVIAVSKAIEALAQQYGARSDRTIVLPNGVDPQVFHPEPVSNDIDLLYVGRFSVEKGIETLVGSLKRLSPTLRVHVVGDGPLLNLFRDQTASLHHQITIHGRMGNLEIPPLIRRSRIQVVPSLSEPQGTVVAEAMACGTPVVASRVGGIVDMIEHGRTGWLVPPGDEEALSEAILRALTDETERQRVAMAALEASGDFLEPVTLAKAIRCYEQLEKSGSPQP